MAELNYIEKSKFESLLGMSSGYVLNFTDRQFQEFVADAIEIDIYDPKYNYRSGSKANRLRGFWINQPNYVVGKLLRAFLEYWLSETQKRKIIYDSADENTFKDCEKIVERLMSNSPVGNLDALKPNNDDKDFSILSKSIKKSIEDNEPEVAIDRLHTFVVKYIRELCNKHSIKYQKDTPLHNLFGSYVKYLVDKNKIESKMTLFILKSSISVLDSFNDVRNNKSLAHDNVVLNYNESVLIFNDIANVIKFIEAVEKSFTNDNDNDNDNDIDSDDLPF